MPIEVNIRHDCAINDRQSAFIRHKAAVIDSEFPDAEFVRVIIDQQRGKFLASFEVQHKGMSVVKSEAEADTFSIAVDAAFLKVEKQLRKHRDKTISQHQRTAPTQ
jgi:ribosomal subunit interface protein